MCIRDRINKGNRAVEYKLRDWLFSRQRYWGEPFPIVHIDDKYKPVLEDELPVLLPDVDKYEPTGTGESPLAAIDNWVNIVDKETGKFNLVATAEPRMEEKNGIWALGDGQCEKLVN